MKKNVFISVCITCVLICLSQNSANAFATAIPQNSRPLQNVGPCQFQIANMFGGEFDVPREHNESVPQQGIYYFTDVGPKAPRVLRSFSLDCWTATGDNVSGALGASQVRGTWMRYASSLGAPVLTPFEKNANPQTVVLKGKNWTGIGLTVDATTGDEEKRPRVFSFCLIHKSKALCGNTPIEWLADPKHNELWMMRSILHSVVFSESSGPPEVTSKPVLTEFAK
jgi:hypothetical protein